jgi:hypothetical protein
MSHGLTRYGLDDVLAQKAELVGIKDIYVRDICINEIWLLNAQQTIMT